MLSNKELDKIAKKVLMKQNSLYLACSTQEQSLFRCSLISDEVTEERVRAQIKKELKEFEGKVEDIKYDYMFNYLTTSVFGYGPSRLTVNELCYDRDLRKYRTLFDLEFKHQRDQIRYAKEDEQFPSDRAYDHEKYLSYFTMWVRMIHNEGLVYATVMSASDYFRYALEEVDSEYIQELIPFDWVEGPDHGKQAGEGKFIGYRWDMQRQCSDGFKGYEKELEELLAYSRGLIEELAEAQGLVEETRPAAVYFEVNYDDPYDRTCSIVVNNKLCADKLELDNFSYCLMQYEEDRAYLQILKKSLTKVYKDKIKEKYTELVLNKKVDLGLDSKVVNIFGD